ncbi:MAG: GcrA family cell cycle regulator [Pseudomonadota bacterium]
MAWTDERVELLKKFWAEGLSASQIASKLGGVTRNAVIGKVHRLGLSGRAAPAEPQKGRLDEILPPADEYEAFEPLPEQSYAPVVLEGGELATVATLSGNMCKWPIGDPTDDDFHFCGQPAAPGKAYCAYHAAIAFQPSNARRAEPAAPRLIGRRAVGQ